MHKFWRDFATQRRVVGALLIREIYTRFGRQGLGFGWIVLEPLIFAIPVLLVWSVVRNPYEHGIALMPFLWSGYLPILLFRHVGSRMLLFVRVNAGLLYHRQVTIFDIFLARCLLEVISNLTAVVASFALFYGVGLLDLPRDLPMFYLGYFYMIWWAAAVGLIVGGLSERTEWAEKFWQPYSYLYMFFSGFLVLAVWLPDQLRGWALFQPSFQAYEMIRAGMLGNAVKTYGDPAYTGWALSVLTFIGLLLMRDSRKYLVAE
ncbi:MAG: ABC transporter permease [Alphaproteobacteria bacterium]|nr:ABC transporter permease [Alphaproteobacteria bacterium]MBV9199570.1 ABC transporter permease [Alphaproteobacteria bacterium]MBV9377812.1 ABC transporter permease [Alphaproteobacteria bacterium]